jgi:DNA-binding response OmpR family regulator
MRILLIEDDDRIAADAASALADAGFSVTRERNGTAATADVVAGGGFAAMVLDLGLPDIDGLHLL